ncbi:MAG: hypothetical protein ED859_17105 [Desulfuromonadales bacterium]|nr:MAG: hypothetical protein ED859_17105 [Desulfuromonadales bacterium]
MSDRVSFLETRVEELTTELRTLTVRVEGMAAQLGMASTPVEQPKPRPVFAAEPESASEEILSWAGEKSLLPRLSTLCFVLVLALVLRTLTDSGIVGKQIGSFIGMGYATLLIGVACAMYLKKSPLAPVFAISGPALLATIVLEVHARFASLPTMPAYGVLIAAGIATAVIGHVFRVAIPVIVGTLGLCLAGAAIDYPNPFFPMLGMLLLTANLLGTFATRLHRCSWLRWILLAVTLFMLVLWATKLGIALRGASPVPPSLAATWFLPTIALFMVTFVATSLLGILTSGQEKISRFDLALPTINAVWVFLSAAYVVSSMGTSLAVHGFVGIAAALGHLGVCVWLAGQSPERARGASAFALAGSALLAMALPLALNNAVVPPVLLAATAFGLAFIAHRWQRGGVRAVSYLLQGYACFVFLALSRVKPAESLTIVAAAAAALVSVIALAHHRWCRTHEPPLDSKLFSRFDRRDLSASLVLMGALTAGFCALRSGSWLALGGTASPTFHSAQTVIITTAAAGLMVVAFVRRNKELRNVAVIVTLVALVKVFFHDLMLMHGMPLVIGIFSFGITAAVQSVVLGRWQSRTSREAETSVETAPPASQLQEASEH